VSGKHESQTRVNAPYTRLDALQASACVTAFQYTGEVGAYVTVQGGEAQGTCTATSDGAATPAVYGPTDSADCTLYAG
jgi:hypothetical protein